MSDWHRLLRRQIGKHLGDRPQLTPEVQALLQDVDAAYRQADADRRLVERSLDLTSRELVQGHRKVREQSHFFRSLLDLNPNIIFAKDRDGRFTFVNRALCELYGAIAEDIVGKTDADFNRNAEEVAHFRLVDTQVIESRREHFVAEEVITDSTGNRRVLQTVKVPLVEADGSVNQLLGVAADITDRKRIEASLQQAQKLESIGVLAAGIAHDFNNLLTPIVIYASVLEQALTPASPLYPDVQDITAAAVSARELTSQLLAFACKQVLEMRVVDLEKEIDRTARMLRRTIPEHIKIEVSLPSEPAYVRVDTAQLQQVVLNLAINARDAMPQGGKLAIDVSRDADWAYVCVSDSGTGIHPEHVAQIFEPFFTTKEQGRGTGLGLAMVYGIVQQHGGSIEVESALGVGTKFRIRLPVTQQALIGASPMPTASGACARETILVVEDNERVRKVVCRTLENEGYRVLSASSGEEAMTTQEHVDLLISDVVMPGMDGPTLLSLFSAKHPTTRAMLMSGYAHDVMSELDVEQAGAQLLRKPFTPPELLKMVRSRLG